MLRLKLGKNPDIFLEKSMIDIKSKLCETLTMNLIKKLWWTKRIHVPVVSEARDVLLRFLSAENGVCPVFDQCSLVIHDHELQFIFSISRSVQFGAQCLKDKIPLLGSSHAKRIEGKVLNGSIKWLVLHCDSPKLNVMLLVCVQESAKNDAIVLSTLKYRDN